jgi:dipeptidyl aminopeptidase/acylaminoacyl peptidase
LIRKVNGYRKDKLMGLTKALSGLIAVLVILATLSGCGSKAGKFTESEVSFQTADSNIVGNLTIPEGKGPFPAVIVLAGSGPFDRNGDVDPRSGEALKLSSTYKDIAYALAQEGFVTLRYDKRGVGNSTGEGGDFPEPSLRDLKAAVSFLKDNPSVDPKRIALVGHSIGGLWALIEAAGNDSIAAVCVMATPAKPFSEVLIEQIDWLVKSQGGNDTDVANYVAQQRAIYDQLRSGELDLSTMSPSERYQYEFVKAIMDVAGADYAREIKCPALILQGDKDLFTNIPQESQLLKEAFIEGGNKDVKLITFANLDHMFRPTPGQPSPQLYYQDRGPISPDVVKTIADWMKTTLH